ncbi:hypothetical protein BurJ1DRAFT_2135 [Burkholderiales bacterium JOSHI_001]|nr:hypothetical protein BurJ1DRAFT_2135 [Burkholderiales bacterium JOSHI_001]
MPWFDPFIHLLAALGLSRQEPVRPATGLVAAVVVFDREDLSMPCIGVADEEAIVDQLSVAVERGAQGKFDGADWSAERIQWFFFGDDAGRLEAVLIEALRAEPRCNGAMLRITRNGIAGPWRETRI